MHVKSLRISVVLGLLVCGSYGVAACSSDEEPGAAPAAGTAGVGGASGSSGASPGGASGNSGAAGSGGTAGGAPTMMCGTLTCTGFAAIPGALPQGVPPCCTGPAADKCGIDLGFGCVELNQPGNPDSTCFAMDGGAGSAGSGAQGGADSGRADSATDSGTAGSGGAGAAGASGTGTGGGGSGGAGTGGTGGRAGVGGTGGFAIPGCCRPDGHCGIMLNLPGFELGCIDVSAVDGGPPPQSCTPMGS